MENFFLVLLDYMPKASVFIYAIGLFLIISVANLLFHWVADLTRLPWMREKNKKLRQQYIENRSKK